jgi:CTP-dependent riboflavin kinase
MLKKTISMKETAEYLNIRNGTLRQEIYRGKILANKDERGRLTITTEQLDRLKEEKNLLLEAIKDHFSIKEIEGMNIPRSLVIDGVIESKMVEGKYYVHFKELKRYLKTIEPYPTLTPHVCEKKLQVLNRGGLHCRPSATIIKICNEYVHKGLSVKISHKNGD